VEKVKKRVMSMAPLLLTGAFAMFLSGCMGFTVRFRSDEPARVHNQEPSGRVAQQPARPPSQGGGALAPSAQAVPQPNRPQPEPPRSASNGGGAIAPAPAAPQQPGAIAAAPQQRPPVQQRPPEPQQRPPQDQGRGNEQNQHPQQGDQKGRGNPQQGDQNRGGNQQSGDQHGQPQGDHRPNVERPAPPPVQPSGPPLNIAGLYPIRNNATVRLQNRRYEGKLFIESNHVTMIGVPGSVIDGDIFVLANNFTLRDVTVNGKVTIVGNNADLTGAHISGGVESQGNGNRW